jgi:hypothetical protein
MSIHCHVNVGPFLKCKVGTKEVQAKRFGCEKCKTWNEHKFCIGCGLACVYYSAVRNEDSISGSSLMEEIEGALCYYNIQEGYHFWFGNNDAAIGYYFDPNEAEDGYKVFHPLDLDHEKEMFCISYKKEIAKLEEAYGKENVEVMWGVVNVIN